MYDLWQVSSIRPSKSDDKRLYIFSGTKTLHLRCDSREDRNSWVEALTSAKDQFPRVLTSTDFGPTVDIVVSTEKLRARLLQESLSEAVVKECESIMLSEVSDLHNQLQSLRQKHVILLDKLRQLEVSYFYMIFFFWEKLNWIWELSCNMFFLFLIGFKK